MAMDLDTGLLTNHSPHLSNQTSAPADRPVYTIIILDDDLVVRLIIESALTKANYQVLMFSNEADMLASGHTKDAHLLLLDIDLAGASGIDVLARLKANARYHDIPVIMITADGRDTTLERCFALGACDYLVKPIKAAVLKSRVEAAISRAQKISALQQEIGSLTREYKTIGDENQKHKKQIHALEMAHQELNSTTQHLANATWRERQRKEELNVALEELKVTKAKVEESRSKILNSITYAQRIQAAFLPSEEIFARLFSASFTLYLPKDIVSGDFYWCYQSGPLTFIGAFDCTGHGVPGAFMSIIGISLLNEIVQTKGIHDVEQVLDQLHIGIFNTLRQGESNNKDGMEATLCCLDKEKKQLHFAGSGNPLIYFKNNECNVIKSGSLPIGGRRSHQHDTFERHTIDMEGVEEVYLLSDGLQDQFGGADARKLGRKNILSFLGSIHHEPMEDQKIKLAQFLDEWVKAGSHPQKQIDDILLIGFRF